jgi:2-polyprenyl-3-methyl-5-hydroxy-6-metoxy-1,4-benzoquinol methylase
MWDRRYSNETYAYGTEPNEFLVSMLDKLPEGRVLCLGEGEGRNATWLAQQGRQVTAVDSSKVGLEKARRLALARGVEITIALADLKDFPIGSEHWDAIVSIFCHLPLQVRRNVHERCVEGLRTGGMLLLEAYTPEQLKYKTGGPPTAEMMMDADSLSRELEGLEFLHLQELAREIREGEYHNGPGAVVQVLAKKPWPSQSRKPGKKNT